MGWHYLRDHSQACRGATPVLSLVLPVVHAGPSQQAPLVLRITVAGPAVPRKSATGPYRGREPLVPATEVDPLDWVLDTLSALATPSDGQALDALRARISTRRLRVLVAGEAKRGKSTLLNRLLGVDVLPVGVVPVTAIATTVRRWRDSTEEFLIVRFDDGHLARRELDALPDFVTETGNPNNRRRVDSVEVLLGAGPLDEYDVELVDTPGTGSVFEHNTLAARDAIQSLDAAIFVVTADPPISAAERDLLQEVAELSVHTFVVLNKADQLDAADLQEAVQFTQSVCSALSGSSTTVFPCSARKGPSDPGYVHFSAELKRYLAAHACADVDAALRGHLRRLAGGMLDGAVLTQRSVQLAATASADQVRLFSERVADVAGRQQELDDRCWAIERGLRRSLDQSAARVRPQVTKICQAAATATLDGELAELAPDALEEQGRQFVIELIRDHVDRWRVGEADILEAGLTAVCDRVAEESERQLAELRDAAHALLDVTLVTQPHIQLLRPSHGFWYTFDRPIGFDPPLAGAVRRVAPGRLRRARTRVLAEIDGLVDRQVGRARADLQQRLQESIRTVLAGLRREHDQILHRMQTALALATELSLATDKESQVERDALQERVHTLRALLTGLNADGIS